MKNKKSSLSLWENTLHKFNVLKVTENFKTADDLLLFLLDFFEGNKRINEYKRLLNERKDTFYKRI